MRREVNPMQARAALIAILALGSGVCLGQVRDQAEHSHHHGSRSVEEWLRILEDPSRDEWQKPAQVVEALGLRPGQDVADIGAGTGYFSVRFAKAVGPGGKVFAVDIDQGLIDHLNERAKDAGLSNLEAVLAPTNDPLLSEKSLDIVFVCDVIHHVQDRQGYYAKLSGAPAARRPSCHRGLPQTRDAGGPACGNEDCQGRPHLGAPGSWFRARAVIRFPAASILPRFRGHTREIIVASLGDLKLRPPLWRAIATGTSSVSGMGRGESLSGLASDCEGSDGNSHPNRPKRDKKYEKSVTGG